MVRSIAGIVLGTACVVVAACSSDDAVVNGGCQGRLPGVLVQVAGIDLKVRDPFGRGQAVGTTAIVHGGNGTDQPAVVRDTLNIEGAFNEVGTFSVTVTRPFYLDATIGNVRVTPNGCVVNTTTVPLTLQLAPGAPALRALAIVGATFLDHVGAQATLLPYFDANPDVSTAVTWQVNDATLASVDANGVVTAKCTKSGGTVKVTATAAADGTTSGTASIGISPSASCP